MQNRYVGDKADLLKLGLLRFLSGETAEDQLGPLGLGVIWYLHLDERHVGNPNVINHDGRDIGYLQPTDQDDRAEYRNLDPDLWDTLHRMVIHEDARCVHCVRRNAILPDTDFFDGLLHFPSYMPRLTRERMRELWLAGALQAIRGSELVYLDPDTGIGRDEWMYRKKGPKYSYRSDLESLWAAGKSLVIYQHVDRTQDVGLREKATLIRDACADPVRLRFGNRVFFVVAQERHRDVLGGRIERFRVQWGQHIRAEG